MEFVIGFVLGIIFCGVLVILHRRQVEKKLANEAKTDSIKKEQVEGEIVVQELDDMLASAHKESINEGNIIAAPATPNAFAFSEKTPTKYRIIFHKTSYYDKYLQYKDAKGDWRCIIDERSAVVVGVDDNYLHRDPSDATYWNVGGYEGSENELHEFVEKWEYIDDYFVYINKLHQDYKREKEEKLAKNGTIENL